MSNNDSPKCEYDNHQNNNEQTFYFCYTCQKTICQNCLNVHNKKKEYINHRYEILNNILIETISKKKKIEFDLSNSYNDIINSNNKEGIVLINDKINKYAKILNSINNIFRKEYKDYINKFNEFDNEKKLLIKNISKIHGDPLTLYKLTIIHDNTNKIYQDLIVRINNINSLYDYTNNVFDAINNNNFNKTNSNNNNLTNNNIINTHNNSNNSNNSYNNNINFSNNNDNINNNSNINNNNN